MPYVQNPRDLLQKSQNTVDRVNQTDLNIRKIIVDEELRRDIANRVELVEGGGGIESSGIEILDNEEVPMLDIEDMPEPHATRILREQRANPIEKPIAQRPIYRVPETPEEFFYQDMVNPTPEVEVLSF